MACHDRGREPARPDRRHRPHRWLDRPGPAGAGLARHRPRSRPRVGRAGGRARRARRGRATTPTPRSPSWPRRSAPSPTRSRGAGATTRGLVTDVGSVKTPMLELMADPRYVGGHPMAGSELEGVDGARADLFEGATWVLTPVPRHRRSESRHRPLDRHRRSVPTWWRSRPIATTRWWRWCPTCRTSPRPP